MWSTNDPQPLAKPRRWYFPLMSSQTAYSAIRDHLQAQLGASYPVRDWEDIDDAMAQSEAAFLVLEDEPGFENPRSFGNPANTRFLEEGSITVHAFVPSDSSADTLRTILDLVAGVFRSRTLAAGVRVTGVSTPAAGGLNRGRWHQSEISISFNRDHIAATA